MDSIKIFFTTIIFIAMSMATGWIATLIPNLNKAIFIIVSSIIIAIVTMAFIVWIHDK